MEPRLYSPWQVATGSALGGPLAACWLMAHNYRALGQPQAGLLSMLWGLGGTIALIALAYAPPSSFPPLVVPIAITIGFFHTAKSLQGPAVADHLAAGGAPGSWPVLIGVSLLFVAAVLGLVLIATLLVGAPPGV